MNQFSDKNYYFANDGMATINYKIGDFPVSWTAPNLILNILFQRILVYKIQQSHPFFKEINSVFNYNHV